MCNTTSKDLKFMNEAFKCAEQNASRGFQEGGPFGAVIVLNDRIVGSGRNQVLANHDPTAHAEVQAIRDACKNLRSHDLTGCVLYTSCYPCPMCLSAIMWSNITKVFYGNTKEDADDIGFRDDAFYSVLNNVLSGKAELNKGLLELSQLGRELTISTFVKFKEQDGQKY